MSVTLVSAFTTAGSTSNYGFSASLSSPAINVPAGALITTGCEVAHGIVPSVSDTAGNTYVVLPYYNGSTNSVNDCYVAYCLSAIANTANVIKWSASGQNITNTNGAVYTTSSGTWSYDTDVVGFASLATFGATLNLSITTAAAGVIACHAFEYYGGAYPGWTFTGVAAESTYNGSASGEKNRATAYADAVTTSAQTGFAASVTDGTTTSSGGKVTAFLVSYTVSGGGGGVSASATQTDGADPQAASGTITVPAQAAQTDGADTQAASAVTNPSIKITSLQVDGTDIQVASLNFNYNTLNEAYLYASQQAATPQFYTMSPPPPANMAVYTQSGTFTVPAYSDYFLVSATAAGGSPYGAAGRQTSRQSLPVTAGDVLTVSISPNVTVQRGAQTLLSLLDGAAYAKGTQGGLPQDSGIVGLGSGVDQGVPFPAALVFIWN